MSRVAVLAQSVPSRDVSPAPVFGEPLSPELQLLVRCAQPSLQRDHSSCIEPLLHRDLDWQRVADLAQLHGLSPLVYTRIGPQLDTPLPGTILKLKRDAVEWTRYTLVHTGEMKRLVPHFQANGIETIVLKGPSLAQRIYGQIALRPFGDLDLLVQPQDVARAWMLLEAEGYAPAYAVRHAQLPALMQADNHLPLHRAADNACVELHWTLFARTRATSFDMRGAWARREPLVVRDLPVMTLAPRDLVHFLLLHGAKHMWCRLVWLTDVAWFMMRYPAFDWSALLEHARQSGTLRMVLVGLALTREVFQCPLENAVARGIAADTQVPPLAAWMWQRLLTGNQTLPTGRELVKLVLRTRERRRDRGRDLYHHFMTPRSNTFEAVAPVARVPGVYALYRFAYLARKYGLTRQ